MTKAIQPLLLCALLLFAQKAFASAPPSGAPPAHVAYLTAPGSGAPSPTANVFEIARIDAKHCGITSCPTAPVVVKSQTDLMPEGHRSIYVRTEFMEAFDVASGQWKGWWQDELQGIPSIYFDEWIEQRSAFHDQWFRTFYDIGGMTDIVLIDFENELSRYIIEVDYINRGISWNAWIQAMTRDRRWPALRARLNQAAAQAGYSNLDFGDLADMPSWRSDTNLRPKEYVWNAVMHARIAEGLNRIVTEPVQRYFPHARISNYDHNYKHRDHLAEASLSKNTASPALLPGAIVGTTPAYPFYGYLDPSSPLHIALPLQWDPPSGATWKWYAPEINHWSLLVAYLRAARGSAVAMPLSPQFAWLTGDQTNNNYFLPAHYSGDTVNYDWHTELIYHLAVHGTKEFGIWNTYRSADGSGEARVSGILRELDQLFGAHQQLLLTQQPLNWSLDKAILSGTRVLDPRGLKDIYRYTPKDAVIVISDFPVTFRHGDGSIEVPVANGRLMGPSQSQLGYWIDATEMATPPPPLPTPTALATETATATPSSSSTPAPMATATPTRTSLPRMTLTPTPIPTPTIEKPKRPRGLRARRATGERGSRIHLKWSNSEDSSMSGLPVHFRIYVNGRLTGSTVRPQYVLNLKNARSLSFAVESCRTSAVCSAPTKLLFR